MDAGLMGGQYKVTHEVHEINQNKNVLCSLLPSGRWRFVL
jgi:hypothetical protein